MLFGGLDIRVPHNNAYFAQGFYASMGFAVPASLGAQIGSGMRPMVMCGDGGFQMTGPEISQAPAKGVNPIVVLINNGGWGIFRPIAERRELLEIPPWPYAQLARDWGGEGFEATTVEQLRDALRAAHRLQVVRDNRRQSRARRPVSGDGEVHQGGGQALAGAGRARGAREFARMTRTNQCRLDRRIIGASYRDFRWETPGYFNFAEVIDKFAEDPRRVAILWEDSEGRRARLTFADIAQQSKRIANVLAGHGIRRGDAVMLVLPRITLWQAAYIGALRLGAIVIPCTAMLREKDLIYRANHSGARAIIASVDNASMIADLRKECPSVEHYLIAGAARSGWISLQEYMGHASAAFKPAATRSSRAGDLLLHFRHHARTESSSA